MSVTLVTIEVRNGDIAKALKLFKKKVEDSGHLQELRERKEYKKPSVVKREQMNKVLYKAKKDRQNEMDRENGITHRKKTK
jgi:small subunit ribosomal protein S21